MSVRGRQIHDRLLADITPPQPQEPPVKLIDLKREAMCYRYYYYTRVIGLRYEDALEWLMKDFFIQDSSIYRILTDCADRIKQIGKDAPKVSQLKEKYPNYSWGLNPIKTTKTK